MGCARLLGFAEQQGSLDAALARLRQARVVARGSKARPVLRRHGVDVDLAPRPATTEGVLAALVDGLSGRRALVQLAGPEPSPLVSGMREAGAEVVAVTVYDYPPGAVAETAHPLVEAILDGRVDALTFTSSPAVDGLVAAAMQAGRWAEVQARLDALVIAAVGPVTAQTLQSHGMPVHVQPPADQPRTGPMMHALAELISSR